MTLVTGASTRGAAEGARAQVVSSDGGSIDAHVVVLAAGAHSAGLASQCGDPVPLDTERGYHVQWPGLSAGRPGDGAEGSSQAGLLTRPVCTPEGGFIVTPMSGGVRAAGLVELGGTCAAPVPERFGQLEDYTRWMLKEDAVAVAGPAPRCLVSPRSGAAPVSPIAARRKPNTGAGARASGRAAAGFRLVSAGRGRKKKAGPKKN